MKESSYDRVLINAANKNALTKNMSEYKNNLWLKTQQYQEPAQVDDRLMSLVNLVTLKYRPTCAFSECKVGLKWYQSNDTCFSESAVTNRQFPKGIDPQ